MKAPTIVSLLIDMFAVTQIINLDDNYRALKLYHNLNNGNFPNALQQFKRSSAPAKIDKMLKSKPSSYARQRRAN